MKKAKLRKMFGILARLTETAYRQVRRGFGIANVQNLYYCVPGKDWSTDWDGFYITRGIREQVGWKAQTTSAPHFLTDHILHYGEAGTFLRRLDGGWNRRNVILATIFHGDLNQDYPQLAKMTQKFLDHSSILKRILVTCQVMEDRLLGWGVEPNKVVRIPLGVDTTHFKPPSQEQRLSLRQKFGIPSDAVCVGSFQKDGVGWNEGLEPKLIKGPDVFLQVIEKLNREMNLFVLLTGPARGYVKKGLDQMAVPYYHEVLPNYLNIIDFYACLDLYLVTSREEGGPKAILESMATGVPIISTQVGLAPEVICQGKNGLLADINDVDTLVDLAFRIVGDKMLQKFLVANARKDILDFDWGKIARQYYDQLYKPVLNADEDQSVTK